MSVTDKRPDHGRLTMHPRRTIIAILVALVGLGGWFAMSRGHKGGQSEKANILYVGNQRGGTKSLMIAAGVLDDLPYRIEWSEFPASQHALEALSAGAIDVTTVGDAPFLFAVAQGAPIRAIAVLRSANAGKSVAIIVPEGSPVRTLADLRGKTVVTGRASIGQYLLIRALRKAGIRSREMKVTYLAPGDAKAAFASGSVDAWATWSPFLSTALLHDKARVIRNGTGLITGEGFQVASNQAIEQKRVQLVDFLDRLSRAYEWAQTHEADYSRSIQRETGLPPDIANDYAAAFLPVAVPISPLIIAHAQDILKDFVGEGQIPKSASATGAFDTSFNVAPLKPH